jgi:hypothetical protein
VTTTHDAFRVTHIVTELLGRVGLTYSIGGSIASSFAGEPRSTLDVDIVVELPPEKVERLVAALGPEFYVDEGALLRAAESQGTANVIHVETSLKVDLFMAGGTAMDGALLARRRPVLVAGRQVFVHTPEDILLQKLRWFRRGGETSDRQWRDIIGIARVQGTRLDLAYLQTGAATLAVPDLLERALREAG